MKKNRFATNFSVGFVLFIATIVVIAGLFIVESGWSVFSDHAEYKVRLPNASGMRPGSVVYLAGVQVGLARLGDQGFWRFFKITVCFARQAGTE